MRQAIAVAALAALGWSAGCDSPPATPSTAADAAFGGWTWDVLKPVDPAGDEGSVCAAWGSWKKKLVYVVVTDGTASSATDLSTSGGRTRYDVYLTWPGGRRAEVRVETADGTTGTVVHAGRSFDLTQGAVFTVEPGGDKFEVRQFQRDLAGQTADLAGVVKFIRNDPEVVRPFAKVKERK